jgi:hypothetical protein
VIDVLETGGSMHFDEEDDSEAIALFDEYVKKKIISRVHPWFISDWMADYLVISILRSEGGNIDPFATRIYREDSDMDEDDSDMDFV